MTTAGVTLRPAARGDLAAVTALDARAYGGSGYGPFVIRQLHDLTPQALLVADIDGVVVGYCAGALATDRTGWILSLAVDSPARGRGIGRGLAEAALAALLALGAAPVRLTVAPTNTAARDLYRSLGFTDERLERDYYGEGEDRLVLVLTER